MLQPSDSLTTHRSSTVQQSQDAQPSSTAQSQTPSVPLTYSPPIKRLVTKRELLFVFVACILGAGLLRVRDSAAVSMVWKEKIDTALYQNGRFPSEGERLPPPIITDLDSDGLSDMVVLTYDHKVKVHSFPADKTRVPGDKKLFQKIVLKASTNVLEHSGGSLPVSVATGYLQPYQSMLQIRHQVIAVLTSDWTVLCFDHKLNLLWKNKVTGERDISLSEAAMLVVPVAVQKSDVGVVIVGGREVSSHKAYQESVKRMRRGGLPENEGDLLSSLGAYSVYALEGGTGEERWTHSPTSSDITPAYPPSSSFQHLKLIIHKKLRRGGEVSWHQFSTALRETLPYSWRDSSDTRFTLGHFKKNRKTDNEHVTEHMSTVRDMAVEHIAGLAFGGQQPHSPEEHVEQPNVLILHSMKGLHVFHLFFGRPVVSLPLSPYHSSHADVDADGTIDHVHSVVNPGEAGPEQEGGGPDCYGKATSMTAASNAKVLFQHSICKATHWTETFIATDHWFPVINKAGRKSVDHGITEPLAPVLVESAYHGAPLKLHLGGGGWNLKSVLESYVGAPKAPPSLHTLTRPHNRGRMYDSVFVLSSGRVTSVGPQGEFNWQTDILADWDDASGVIYDPAHPHWEGDSPYVTFLHNVFTPSAMPLSLRAYGKKDHILVVGLDILNVLSAEDGELLSTVKYSCPSMTHPVVADFTGDGWNDIIITCPTGHVGFTIGRHSGLWQSIVVSVFVGVVIVIVAVYTRQRTITLVPLMKAAQD